MRMDDGQRRAGRQISPLEQKVSIRVPNLYAAEVTHAMASPATLRLRVISCARAVAPQHGDRVLPSKQPRLQARGGVWGKCAGDNAEPIASEESASAARQPKQPMFIFVCRLLDAFGKMVGGVSAAQHPAHRHVVAK
jgi:hypothetical protein